MKKRVMYLLGGSGMVLANGAEVSCTGENEVGFRLELYTTAYTWCCDFMFRILAVPNSTTTTNLN